MIRRWLMAGTILSLAMASVPLVRQASSGPPPPVTPVPPCGGPEKLQPPVIETPGPPISVKGFNGGSKVAYFNNPVTKKILLECYGITISAHPNKNSRLQVTESVAGQDFIFPTDDRYVDLYRELQRSEGAQKRPLVDVKKVFTTPLVFFSWPKVVDALVAQGIATHWEGNYYRVDFQKLAELMRQRKKWKDIGITDLGEGEITIYATEPINSASGGMYAALLTNMLAGNKVANEQDATRVVPDLTHIYDNLGKLKTTSADLFKAYIDGGYGALNIIADYESLAVDYYNDPQTSDRARVAIREQVRIMVPEPTVWGEHYFFALTPNGARLLQALSDPDLQRIALMNHGLRSGFIETQDTKSLPLPGMPNRITTIMPLPNFAVKRVLDQALEYTTK